MHLHSKIKFRWVGIDENGEEFNKWYETTPGRALLGQVLPRSSKVPFDVVNKLMTKREISGMIDTVYRHCGQKETVIFCDRIMALGFYHAFKAGISFGKDDMVVPKKKWDIVDKTRAEAKDFEQQYNDGLITQGEKYNKVVDAWSKSTDRIAEEMMKEISAVKRDEKTGREAQVNSIYMMAHSGARGSPAQMRQLAGMRGLMAKPSGEIIESPIISNFKEGLSVLEYFNSTHGARKGLADTALKTANSGYLTRRLVDVAQDCIITSYDCGTKGGITVRAIIDSGTVVASLASRILGRTTAEDVKDPSSSRIVIKRDTLLGEKEVEEIVKANVQELRIRSVLTCENTNGVCGACYGRDLARGTPVNMGEAVGVIAAQSIGEPGTQLTMRTFHIGGAAQISEQSFIESNFDGKIDDQVQGQERRRQELGRPMDCHGPEHRRGRGRSRRHRTRGSPHPERRAAARRGRARRSSAAQRIAEWDPYTRPILTETDGTVGFEDLVEGQSMSETVDESTGIAKRVVTDWRTSSRAADLRPAIVIKGKDGKVQKLARGGDARYMLAVDAILSADLNAQREGRRRDRPYPDRKRQDARHHRRSAAGGGAVRGAAAEGGRGHRRDVRHRAVRQGLQEQAPAEHRPAGWRRARGISHSQGQAHPSAGRRLDREGRLHRRRQSGAARHPGDQGRRGARELPRQRDPGRLPAAGRGDQRQAHRGDRSPDAAEGRARPTSVRPT